MDKYCFNLILEGNLSSLPPSVQKIIGSLRSVGKPYSISHFTTVLLTWIVKQNLLNFAIEYYREQRPLIG